MTLSALGSAIISLNVIFAETAKMVEISRQTYSRHITATRFVQTINDNQIKYQNNLIRFDQQREQRKEGVVWNYD